MYENDKGLVRISQYVKIFSFRFYNRVDYKYFWPQGLTILVVLKKWEMTHELFFFIFFNSWCEFHCWLTMCIYVKVLSLVPCYQTKPTRHGFIMSLFSCSDTSNGSSLPNNLQVSIWYSRVITYKMGRF